MSFQLCESSACTVNVCTEFATRALFAQIPCMHTSSFTIRAAKMKSIKQSAINGTDVHTCFSLLASAHTRACEISMSLAPWCTRVSRISKWKDSMPSIILTSIKSSPLMPIRVNFGAQTPRQLKVWTRNWKAPSVSVTAIPKNVRLCNGFFDMNMINQRFSWSTQQSLYSIYASLIHAKNLHQVYRAPCRSACGTF